MARMEEELADARDRAQTLINLELRRYSRRFKKASEDFVNDRYAAASAKGLEFDHKKVADEAVLHALKVVNAGNIEAVG